MGNFLVSYASRVVIYDGRAVIRMATGLHVKLDCTQERHLFISTKHPLTPFVKLCNILNLAVRNIFYVQSAFTYNPGSTVKINRRLHRGC